MPIQFSNVTKVYPGGQTALGGITFDVADGELVFISGHSGAGKSTLLKLIAAVERPTAGTVVVNGQNVGTLTGRAIPYLRRNLGIIFQDTQLLYDRSALENVMLPLIVTGNTLADARKRAQAALEKVGLHNRERANPIELSGGDQQRLAIARAIVNRPAVLLADEPTANLDRESSRRIVEVFRSFHQVGVTVLISTHDDQLIRELRPRVLHLSAGTLQAGFYDVQEPEHGAGQVEDATPQAAAARSRTQRSASSARHPASNAQQLSLHLPPNPASPSQTGGES